ncbi:MAG TPA: hypothetical protein PKO06_18570, partial [Candidatus Ozemobacteraceae bacterium]|nr:hypothetical protein [Candidatus Ozemobacteraceae bacterium]
MRSISRGMMSLRRRMLGILVAGLATLWLSGCTSESGNKIAVQTVGTGSPQQEWGTEYPIDA